MKNFWQLNFLKRLPLVWKMILGIIPVTIIVAVLSTNMIINKLDELKQTDDLDILSDKVSNSAEFIRNIQLARAYGSAVLAGDRQMTDEWREIRRKVENLYPKLREYLELSNKLYNGKYVDYKDAGGYRAYSIREFTGLIEQNYQRVEKCFAALEKSSGKNKPSTINRDRYFAEITELISKYLALLEIQGIPVSRGEERIFFETIKMLMQLSEFAAQERGFVTGWLAEKQNSDLAGQDAYQRERLANWGLLIGYQEIPERDFMISLEQCIKLLGKQSNPFQKALERYQMQTVKLQLLRGEIIQQNNSVSDVKWLEVTTDRINSLYDLEKILILKLQEITKTKTVDTKRKVILVLISFLISLLVSVYIGFFVVYWIKKGLDIAVNGVEKFAEGRPDLGYDPSFKDEIGILQEKMNELLMEISNQILVIKENLQNIALGDFTTSIKKEGFKGILKELVVAISKTQFAVSTLVNEIRKPVQFIAEGNYDFMINPGFRTSDNRI